jgi:hypothetical protein
MEVYKSDDLEELNENGVHKTSIPPFLTGLPRPGGVSFRGLNLFSRNAVRLLIPLTEKSLQIRDGKPPEKGQTNKIRCGDLSSSPPDFEIQHLR